MMHAMLAVATVLLASDASSTGELRARVGQAPKEVTAFIERRAGCNHFQGEERYDRERAAELNKAIRDLRCAGLARDERRLRRTYRHSPLILGLLDETADSLGL